MNHIACGGDADAGLDNEGEAGGAGIVIHNQVAVDGGVEYQDHGDSWHEGGRAVLDSVGGKDDFAILVGIVAPDDQPRPRGVLACIQVEGLDDVARTDEEERQSLWFDDARGADLQLALKNWSRMSNAIRRGRLVNPVGDSRACTVGNSLMAEVLTKAVGRG